MNKSPFLTMLQSVLLLCIGLCMSLPVSAQLKQVTQLKSGTYYRIKTGNHNSGQTAQQTPYLADVAGVVKTQALNTTSGDAGTIVAGESRSRKVRLLHSAEQADAEISARHQRQRFADSDR